MESSHTADLDIPELNTRIRESAVLGHPTANMDILWAQQCITTGVKMSTSRLRLANASWTHSSFFHTIIRCPSYPPLTDCSWRPTTCQMHYNTRIRRYLSLTSEITLSLRSQHWRKFSNSNLKSSHSHNPCPSCPGHSTNMPPKIIQSNLDFSRAPNASNEITYNNSRSTQNKRAITSEGDHTNVGSSFTSKGAKTLTKSCPPATCLKTTSVEWKPPT
jgi:hypothetical protein